MLKKFLEIGKIVSTHGIKGEVKIEPWCDSPQFFAKFKRLYFNGGEREVKISSRQHKRMIIAKLDGVDTGGFTARKGFVDEQGGYAPSKR